MTFEFLYDFGSPNAFLAHRVLSGIESRTGAKADYVPILLGGVFKATNNVPPMQAFGNIANKMAYMRLETRRFVAKHHIEDLRSNPHFPVNTLQLMRGAVHARHTSYYQKYIDAVFNHMWAEPKKMDDEAIFRAALSESNLPSEEILEGTRDPSIKQLLIDSTQHAVERGVFGSPSFFVDDELFFGKDTLHLVEEALSS